MVAERWLHVKHAEAPEAAEENCECFDKLIEELVEKSVEICYIHSRDVNISNQDFYFYLANFILHFCF